MGAIPFLILVVASALNTIGELEDFSKQNNLLRNTIISEHMSEFIEKNQMVLKSIALSPNVIDFLQAPTDPKYAYVSKVIHDTNIIFDDNNTTALTGSDGWQIIRTDDSTLVNLNKRQHFQEAMKGKHYVTDIISSMSRHGAEEFRPCRPAGLRSESRRQRKLDYRNGSHGARHCQFRQLVGHRRRSRH